MIVTVAALGFALPCSSAPAATAPAGDEYTLEVPGLRDGKLQNAGLTGSPEPGATQVQAGVSGETGPSASPLDSARTALLGGPGAIALSLMALALLMARGLWIWPRPQ